MSMSFRRGIIVLIGIVLQLGLTLFAYLYLASHLAIVNVFYNLLGFLLILYLIKDSKNYSYTLPWIIIVLIFPIIGSLLYITLGRNKKNSKVLKKIVQEDEISKKYFVQDKKIQDSFLDNGRLKFISEFAGYPVSNNNTVHYYGLGEEAYPKMLEELKKAEKFIFFEYFIVNHGKMWDSILEILEEKAKAGLDVRVIYDDLGCFSTLDDTYPKELEDKGIKCISFNPLTPIAGVIMNNRDHRKMLIIDGKIAFSGGINIADEYINEVERFGHWKDNAFSISGDAVWNYTVMFLSMWNAFRKDDSDYTKYQYHFKNKKKNGFVAPYGETPLDGEEIGKSIYLNIISQAKKYLYIFTPYLIIDTDMINALSLAAKRGVDVRIVIPGIPDKKIVYTLSESYLPTLVKNGVKVYKYTPGFVHAKVFVADDKMATVGTINMDYRSLYLHFECGCYFEDVDVIEDVKKDVLDTISKSDLVLEKDVQPKFLKSMWQAVLRIVAPLM